MFPRGLTLGATCTYVESDFVLESMHKQLSNNRGSYEIRELELTSKNWISNPVIVKSSGFIRRHVEMS